MPFVFRSMYARYPPLSRHSATNFNPVVARAQYDPARLNPRRTSGSEFDLLGKREGILDLDAEVLDGAFDLRMTEQELDGA